jgi:hypothetical protein
MAKALRTPKRTDLLLGTCVLGVLLLIAVCGALLWLT